MRGIIVGLLGVGLVQSALMQPVLAKEQDLETNVVKDKPDAILDPAKAYMLVESSIAVPITFFQIPSDEERDEDRQKHAEALATEHSDWERAHALWEKRIKEYKPTPGGLRPPAEPIEPNYETFPWTPLEVRRMVTLGPSNRFRKSDDVSLFLQEVPPGEYAYYGSINLGLGVCTCMGTVKFEVVPGKVVAMRYDFAFMDGHGTLLRTSRKLPEGVNRDDALTRVAMFLEQGAPNGADSRIPAEMLVPAEFEAMPTLPNWFGAEINRLQPIEGVLAYDRDQVINEIARSSQEAVDQAAAEEVKIEPATAEAVITDVNAPVAESELPAND